MSNEPLNQENEISFAVFRFERNLNLETIAKALEEDKSDLILTLYDELETSVDEFYRFWSNLTYKEKYDFLLEVWDLALI